MPSRRGATAAVESQRMPLNETIDVQRATTLAGEESLGRAVLGLIDSRPDLQPWRGHARLRLRELSWILRHVDGRLGTTVEVGCGNGLSAVVLSARSDVVVATDLPFVGPECHAIGLSATKAFLASAGMSTPLVGCSGERLPFEDATVDTVFMLYALEHVPDRARCLREVGRVLRPGGRLVTVVPAVGSSVVYPLAFYAELTRRVLRRMAGARRRTDQGAVADRPAWAAGAEEPLVRDWASFRRAYPHFPAPNPHGEFASYTDELRSQRVSQWELLISNAGLALCRSVTMSVVPVQLLLALFGSAGERLHAKAQWLDERVCERPWTRHLAQGVCIEARKAA